jgi:hypothetical protein
MDVYACLFIFVPVNEVELCEDAECQVVIMI